MTPPVPAESEPIIGYRAWKILRRDNDPTANPDRNKFLAGDGEMYQLPLLGSRHTPYMWPQFKAATALDRETDFTPSAVLPGNSCGIYATKDESGLIGALDDPEVICGAVNLWGTVIEHSAGYRAEFAYPRELWIPDDGSFDPVSVMQLEEAYGVPVVSRDLKHLTASPPPPPAPHFHVGSALPSLRTATMEIVKGIVYDTVRVPAAPSQCIYLFQMCLGQMDHELKELKHKDRTNMVQAGMLPPPHKMMVRSLRVVFARNGVPVPLSDPIWWKSTVMFSVNQKKYWESLAYKVCDPAVFFLTANPSLWMNLSPEERLDMISGLRHQLFSDDVPPHTCKTCGGGGVIHSGNSAKGTITRKCYSCYGTGQMQPQRNIEGVLIDTQACFCVSVEFSREILAHAAGMDVLCALEGEEARAIF